jgi:hypothetical protein
MFDDATLERFHADFERLLRHRRGLQGLAKAREFSRWWEAHRTTYLTRPVVETYRKAELSLGELLDDLHLHFLAVQKRARADSRVGRAAGWLGSRVPQARFMLPVLVPLAYLAGKALTFIMSLIILGPGVQMVNSYTQPVITPLAQTAVQKGSHDLAAPALMIQAWLTNRQQLAEVRREIASTSDKLRHYDFKGLTPEQTQAKWQEFEKVYFDLFLRYNQTLPSHLRDGRSFYRDWMIYTQVALSANLATFDVQYWTHRRELDALTAREARGERLWPEERKLKALHEREAAAAESRIAGALAAWKIYQFMYPEFATETSPLNAKARGELRVSYSAFVRSMRFDVYLDQFLARVSELLKQMDADFLVQDELANGELARMR